MYRVVENSQNEFNYKMTSNEAKKFGQALNKKLEGDNGLLRFLVLQGNGLSESHGGMEWLNYVSANNYEYIIPMYYSNINDTGSTVIHLNRIIHANNTKKYFACLINNIGSKFQVEFYGRSINKVEKPSWYVFPWEIES